MYIYVGVLFGMSWLLIEWLQIVVGRIGTEMLTNEAGEVTRYLLTDFPLSFPNSFIEIDFIL